MEMTIVEVMPKIKSCTLFSKTKWNFENLLNIMNTENSCIFTFKDSTKVVIKFPPGIRLIPNSHSGYKYDGASITLRIQMGERTTLIQSLMSDLINDIESLDPFSDGYLHFKPDTSVSISCRCCSTLITKPVLFRRTCQLPSVNWEHASEDWFCCLSKPVKDSLKPYSLEPDEEECFYGELFYVLNKKNLFDNVFVVDGKVTCHECNFDLGNLKNSSAVFWKHSIKWRDEKDKVLYYQTESETLVSLFDNIDKDNFGVNCRLVLEKQTKPKQFLLIVTMDTNLKLLMSDNVLFTSKYKTFYNADGTERNSDKMGNEISLKKLCVDSIEECSNVCDNETVDLNKHNVIRVLFKHTIGEDQESAQWIDDVNVHILPCGDKFFDAVLNDLNNASHLLPGQSRIIKDMNVGYISRG